MITTEGSESHVVQALSAGARGYIRKPFTPDQVKEHVLPLLGKKPRVPLADWPSGLTRRTGSPFSNL
jgi:DNA-binding response OmpR family regulator